MISGLTGREPSHLHLLKTEKSLFSTFDDRGRLCGSWGLEVLAATDGHEVVYGADLGEELVGDLDQLFDGADFPASPVDPPPVVRTACEMLGTYKSVAISGGPNYLVRQGTASDSDLRTYLSTDDDTDRLLDEDPGIFPDDRWRRLIANERGPWAAVATRQNRVISLCHTPVPMNAEAAEAGVWTRSDHRGRGYASAAVCGWATAVVAAGRRPFYSTEYDNLRSQRVAARLGMAYLGSSWAISEVL